MKNVLHPFLCLKQGRLELLTATKSCHCTRNFSVLCPLLLQSLFQFLTRIQSLNSSRIPSTSCVAWRWLSLNDREQTYYKAKFWKDPKRHCQNAQRRWTSYPCCQDKWANSETISIKFVPIVAKIVRKSIWFCGVRGETRGVTTPGFGMGWLIHFKWTHVPLSS